MNKVSSILIAMLFVVVPNIFAQDMKIDSDGITLEGNIEMKNGGIIFPDGTVLDNAYLNTNDGTVHGQPFQALQQQIDELSNS